MQLNFNKQVVLITNADTVIGSACVKELVANNATVIAHYFDSDSKIMAELIDKSKNSDKDIVYIYKADLTSRKVVDDMIEDLIIKFGSIDALIVNNKVSFPIKTFMESSFFDVDDGITKEIKSLMYCSQAVLKNMIKNKNGKIIIINNSFSKYSGYGSISYAAAKSAIESIAKIMALELSRFGISVNVVSPGFEEKDNRITQINERKDFLVSETLKVINFLILNPIINGSTFMI